MPVLSCMTTEGSTGRRRRRGADGACMADSMLADHVRPAELQAVKQQQQQQCHLLLFGGVRYFKSREMKGRAMDMFPPGRIVFIRPIKQVDEKGHQNEKHWDTVWVQPTEIIAEGILISPKACPAACSCLHAWR